jgi:hypothetical protein
LVECGVKLAGALAVAAMLGVACHRDEPVATPSAPIVERELPADLSIELERTWCLGTCPIYVVKIGATGAVEWEGRDYVDVEGPQRSQVSIDEVRGLYTRFDAIGFSTLHDSYNVAVTDLDWAILTLRHGGLSKSVVVRGGEFVDQQNTMLVISGIPGFVRWRDDEVDEPAADANGVVVRTDSDVNDSPQHAAAAKAFHALENLALAIDKAANTAQWIGTKPKKRHR